MTSRKRRTDCPDSTLWTQMLYFTLFYSWLLYFKISYGV